MDEDTVMSSEAIKRVFSYEEAIALLPAVQRLTSVAVEKVDGIADDAVDDYQLIVGKWAAAIIQMGIEVKGLWLIDFDNGSGYYCWRHPESSLQYFHGYEEGFGSRLKLN